MNNFPHSTTLVLGDWSDDGHGKTEIIIIHSNLDSEEITIAYNKASKKLGFKFMDDVCADYEDSGIPQEYLNTLIKNGLKLEAIFDTDYDLKEAREVLEGDDPDETVGLWTHSYTQIFLFIVKMGNPEFEYKIVEDDSNRIDIGGYGLFGS